MMNQYYQSKLLVVYDNIDFARQKTNETYETIMRLPYLDLVFLNQRLVKKDQNNK